MVRRWPVGDRENAGFGQGWDVGPASRLALICPGLITYAGF